MKRIITLLSMVGLAFAASAQPQMGRPAPAFGAWDVNGKIIKLSDYKGKIVVLEAHDIRCDATRLQYESGAMPALQRELASNGVVWLVIDPGLQNPRTKRKTPAEAKKEWASQKMAIADYIIDDTSQSLCKKYGMYVISQMAVIDTKGVLAYTGAIDDDHTVVGAPQTGRNYVRNAVNELLAGKKVSVPHVKPNGCPIWTVMETSNVMPNQVK